MDRIRDHILPRISVETVQENLSFGLEKITFPYQHVWNNILRIVKKQGLMGRKGIALDINEWVNLYWK